MFYFIDFRFCLAGPNSEVVNDLNQSIITFYTYDSIDKVMDPHNFLINPDIVEYKSDFSKLLYEDDMLLILMFKVENLNMNSFIIRGLLPRIKVNISEYNLDNIITKTLLDDDLLFNGFKNTKKRILDNITYLKLKDLKNEFKEIEWYSISTLKEYAFNIINNPQYSCPAFEKMAKLKNMPLDDLALETLNKIRNYEETLLNINTLHAEITSEINNISTTEELRCYLVVNKFKQRIEAIEPIKLKKEDLQYSINRAVENIGNEIEFLNYFIREKLKKLSNKKISNKKSSIKVINHNESSSDDEYLSADEDI